MTTTAPAATSEARADDRGRWAVVVLLFAGVIINILTAETSAWQPCP